MKAYDAQYLNDLTSQAKNSPRLRQRQNIHQSYQDPRHRLFNAIEPGSYIRPHRHASEPREELLIGIRGSMLLIMFDEQSSITGILRFSSEKYGSGLVAAAEVPSSNWHIKVALLIGCVLLEVKASPFDPNRPKDLSPWAPEEDSQAVESYLQYLISRISG